MRAERPRLWSFPGPAAILLAASMACGDDASPTDAAVSPDVTTTPACEPNGNRCDATQYCLKGLGFCRSPGTCTERPTSCPDGGTGVCGCDGESYEKRLLGGHGGNERCGRRSVSVKAHAAAWCYRGSDPLT